MSGLAHPPLVRRRRSNELRKAMLEKHRDALTSTYVTSEWLDELAQLPVAPTLLISSAEVPGEVLRLATKYLKARYYSSQTLSADAALAAFSGEENSNGCLPQLGKFVPHPHTSQGLGVVGKAYRALESSGFNVYKLQVKKGATRPTEQPLCDLYDSVALAKAVKHAVELELRKLETDPAAQFSSPKSHFENIGACANKGRRISMEDKHVIIEDLNAYLGLEDAHYPSQAFFAVYDGHGGVEAAEYTRTHLHANIALSPLFKSDPERAIVEGFSITDKNFLRWAEWDGIVSGCTCVVSLMRGSTLHTAWLGDSQAILSRRGMSTLTLCQPHKPERADERARIEGLGGVVVWHGAWRVNGVLSVARAIGDRQLKKYVVSDCDIISTTLTGDERFLCLACDGLWDVMDSRGIVEFVDRHVEEGKENGTVAQGLVKHALELGSGDNISIIVVFFKNSNVQSVVAASSDTFSPPNWPVSPGEEATREN